MEVAGQWSGSGGSLEEIMKVVEMVEVCIGFGSGYTSTLKSPQ